jgi:hypothetical protein
MHPLPPPTQPLPFVAEIDFDVVPPGTVINAHYGGVTFEGVALNNPSPSQNFKNVFASSQYDQALADSPRNVITIIPSAQSASFNDQGGGVLATFGSPQLYVSIDVRPVIDETEFLEPLPTSVPYLEIFGTPIRLATATNETVFPRIATVYGTTTEQWQRLGYFSTSPTPNIGAVLFSCHFSGIGAPVFSLFDRFRFSAHLPLPATHYIG